jgi:predicted MFS family arabinose efflux permease
VGQPGGIRPVLAAALAWERRLARAGGQPLIDLSLFRQRSFASGLAIGAAFMAAFTSGVFVATLLLQDGLGLSPLSAGESFGPMALTGIAAPLIGRRLLPRYGPFRLMLAGALINAASLLALTLGLQALGAAITPPWIIVTLAVTGLGNMLILPALIGSALSGVRPDQAGVASGTFNTTQQFAGAAGIAVIGAVFFAALGRQAGRAGYAHAAAEAVWIDLALTLVIAALSAVLAPRRAVPARRSTPGVDISPAALSRDPGR